MNTTTTRPGRCDALYAPLETAAADLATRLHLAPSYLHTSRATGTVEHLHLRMNTLPGKQFVAAVTPALAGPEFAFADKCPVCSRKAADTPAVEYAKAA